MRQTSTAPIGRRSPGSPPRLLAAVRASGRVAVALAATLVLAQARPGPAAWWPSDSAVSASVDAGERVHPAARGRTTDSIGRAPEPAEAAPGATPAEPATTTTAPLPTPDPPAVGLPPAAAPPATAAPPTATAAPPPATAAPPAATAAPGAAAVARPTDRPDASGAAARPTGEPTSAPPARARAGPLRGIGYNPLYAKEDAEPAARAARLQRDLRLMAEVGVDMVLGWDPFVFDEALLDAAEANGVAVLLPFEMRPEYNYAEPETRAQLLEAVRVWVERYRHRPGVLMWAIGNEVTLEMGEAERRAYADFYAELLPRVRAADPTRPVVIREAEDVFAPYLAEALARRGAARTASGAVAAPPGFVYGVNFYTDRVRSAVDAWIETTGLDAPLLVSEYAPAGVGRAGRAERLARMHAEIAAAGPRVVGSAPYTWTTSGPEAVDAYFGLVDAEGRPVDGTVAALARLYGVEPPPWARVTDPVDERREDPSELGRLITAAVDEAARQGGQDPEAIRAGVLTQTRQAATSYGVAADEGSSEGTWAVAQLLGWARTLSVVRRDDERLFPGLHEALPLLDGMARWSAVEPSADETARSFVSSVLRRDLENAARREAADRSG